MRFVSTPPRYCYRHPDRETGLSCSECGRPICYECMTPAAVGLRCPDHSGKPQGVRRVATGARRSTFEGTDTLVTKTLLGVNIAIYVITAAQGSGINSPGGSLFAKWLLYGPAVANGDWWRLITSAFLHANLIHIAFNMYFLWFVGSAVETALGRGRFLAVYLISGLAGSAGALVLSRFGRGHAAYSPVGLWGIAGVLAVGLLSIAVAYLKVRGYAQ